MHLFKNSWRWIYQSSASLPSMTSLKFINFLYLNFIFNKRISSYFAAKKEVERSVIHRGQTEETSYQKHRLSAKKVLSNSSTLDDKVNASITTNDCMNLYTHDIHLELFPPLPNRLIYVLIKIWFFYTVAWYDINCTKKLEWFYFQNSITALLM